MSKKRIVVAIIMGSDSDWPIMKYAAKILDEIAKKHELKIISIDNKEYKYYSLKEAEKNGLNGDSVAGGSAHLPGMVASKTTLPVLGVPVPSKHLEGHDSLLSIVQMPKGIPVATFAIGEPGSYNAGLFAASLIAVNDKEVRKKILAFYYIIFEEKVLNMKLDAK